MTVTTVHKDPKTLSMTITAELDARPERAWQLWADPRQLERWWGPPTHPATFVDHDLTAGGRITYFMTGPEGDQPLGCWEVVAVEPPRRLELKDAFTDDSGTPLDGLGLTTMVVTLTDSDAGGTLMAIESRFASLAAMEEMVTGFEEGMNAAMRQIAAILAEDVTAR